MSRNIDIISGVVNYIDSNIGEQVNLDSIAKAFGYSKYHLHRMFTAVVGIPIHTYTKRRRLTEAAYKLVSSDISIVDIALATGYESQQSFTDSFRSLYKTSPDRYRKRKRFKPLQDKFDSGIFPDLKADDSIKIDVKDIDKLELAGFSANTSKGFWVIGICHRKLNKILKKYPNIANNNDVIGLNDYSEFESFNGKISYEYLAAFIAKKDEPLPEGMETRIIPASKYATFTFYGNKKASTEHIAKYVYTNWFPRSTLRFNEKLMLDFFRYYDETNDKGLDKIEYFVPVIEQNGVI